MDNRLIDLIMNLRICYDKSIEIQLFKELLKTKFLYPISIDDQQNLIITSVVDSNVLNFLPLYIKEGIPETVVDQFKPGDYTIGKIFE